MTVPAATFLVREGATHLELIDGAGNLITNLGRHPMVTLVDTVDGGVQAIVSDPYTRKAPEIYGLNYASRATADAAITKALTIIEERAVARMAEELSAVGCLPSHYFTGSRRRYFDQAVAQPSVPTLRSIPVYAHHDK